MNPQNILICGYPIPLTVRDVRSLIEQRDNYSRCLLADLILHRLRNRYITPLEHVPTDYKSGFLMMAASCLLIEAFQSFQEGREDTEGQGKAVFKEFFSTHSVEFCRIDGEEFYKKVRCGILHQAETRGLYRIVRTGKTIFDDDAKTIDATMFLATLKRIVEDYVAHLRDTELQDDAWKNPLLKIKYICDAIEKESPRRRPRARRR